jgi:hypothetical protein
MEDEPNQGKISVRCQIYLTVGRLVCFLKQFEEILRETVHCFGRGAGGSALRVLLTDLRIITRLRSRQQRRW